MTTPTKRLAAACFGAAVATTMLSACGGDSSSSDPESVEIFTAASSPVAGPPPADWFWTRAIKKDLGLDVKTTVVTDTSQYTPKLQARAAGNDLPDLFRTDATTMAQLVQQGIVGDWKPYLKDMPEWRKVHDSEKFDSVGTFDGKLYGLTARNGYPYKGVVAVRADWLDKLGLDEPKTLDDYLEVATAFAKDDPDGNGKDDTFGWCAAPNADGSVGGFDPVYGAFGALGTWTEEGGKLGRIELTDNRRDALEFIHQMDEAGAIDADWKAQKPEDCYTKEQAGTIGMWSADWCAALCEGDYRKFRQANPQGVVHLIRPPIGPDGDQANSPYSQVGFTWGISQAAIDAGKGESIAKLLNWTATDKGYLLTVFGEEGKDKGWTRLPDGSIQQNNANSAYYPFFQLNTLGLRGTEDEFKSRYGGATTKQGDGTSWNPVKDIIPQLDAWPKIDTTKYAALPPAPPDVSADLLRTMNEGQFQFATGQRPIDEWDDYVAETNASGMEQWVADAEGRREDVGLIGGK